MSSFGLDPISMTYITSEGIRKYTKDRPVVRAVQISLTKASNEMVVEGIMKGRPGDFIIFGAYEKPGHETDIVEPEYEVTLDAQHNRVWRKIKPPKKGGKDEKI